MSRLIEQALSQENSNVTDAEVSELEAMENEVELVEEMHSADLAEAELTQLETESLELEHAADVLEEINASLSQSLESDERGITRELAGAYDLAHRGVFGTALSSPFVSLESFGGDSERKRATELSLEESQSKLGKIVDKIVQAIQKVWEKFKEIIASIFSGVERLKKSVAKLKSKIQGAKNNNWEKSSEKFEAPKADQLQIGGKVDKDTIETGLDRVEGQVVTGFAAEFFVSAGTYFSALSEGFKKAKDDDPTNSIKKAYEAVKDWVKGNKSGDPVTEELPGGKAILMEVHTMELGDQSMEIPGSPKIGAHPKGKDKAQSAEMDTPDLDTLEGWCERIESILDTISRQKELSDQLKEHRKNLIQSVKEIQEASGKGKLSSWWDQTKTRKALWFANRSYDSGLAKVNNYALKYAKNLSSMINTAFKQYKKPES